MDKSDRIELFSYLARFRGRPIKSLGYINQQFGLHIYATSIDAVRPKLYRTHEHIAGLCVSASPETQAGDPWGYADEFGIHHAYSRRQK